MFIEEINEEPYKIDRMLTQLRLSGKLREAKGIILGDFNNCQSKNSQYGGDSYTRTGNREYNKTPRNTYSIQFKISHCKPMITLPLEYWQG